MKEKFLSWQGTKRRNYLFPVVVLIVTLYISFVGKKLLSAFGTVLILFSFEHVFDDHVLRKYVHVIRLLAQSQTITVKYCTESDSMLNHSAQSQTPPWITLYSTCRSRLCAESRKTTYHLPNTEKKTNWTICKITVCNTGCIYKCATLFKSANYSCV